MTKGHSELLEETERLRERVRLLVASHKNDAKYISQVDSINTKLVSNIGLLLNQIGDQGKCRGCGKDI